MGVFHQGQAKKADLENIEPGEKNTGKGKNDEDGIPKSLELPSLFEPRVFLGFRGRILLLPVLIHPDLSLRYRGIPPVQMK